MNKKTTKLKFGHILFFMSILFHSFTLVAQDTTDPLPDTGIDEDGDGVVDEIDQDDDNDGILDVDEFIACNGSSAATFSIDSDSYNGNAFDPEFEMFVYDNQGSFFSHQMSFSGGGSGFQYNTLNNNDNDDVLSHIVGGSSSNNFTIEHVFTANGNSKLSGARWGLFRQARGGNGTLLTVDMANPDVTISWTGAATAVLREFAVGTITDHITNYADGDVIPNGAVLDFRSNDGNDSYRQFNFYVEFTIPDESNFTLTLFHNNKELVNNEVFDIAVDLCTATDTDSNSTVDILDFDADDDGCPDALEGGGSFTSTDLDGNTLCSDPSCVDPSTGIPTAGSQSASAEMLDGIPRSPECTPVVSIDSPTVTESETGTVDLVFTVTNNNYATEAFTLNYTIANGTTDNADYAPFTNGTITFPAGSITGDTQTITVTVNADGIIEADETLTMTLSNPTSAFASIGTAVGTGTIIDIDTILPVELTEFTVNADECSAILVWETATETNNSHFEVQRSTYGLNFEVIGQVQGAGTTIIPEQYTYIDETIETSGIYFYRLRQIDFDGTSEFSDQVLALNIECKTGSVYPVPVIQGGDVILAKEGIELIQVFDMIGRLVFVDEYDGRADRATINSGQFAPGNYILIVNKTEQHRLIVQ